MNPNIGITQGNVPAPHDQGIDDGQSLGSHSGPGHELLFLKQEVIVETGVEDRRKSRGILWQL